MIRALTSIAALAFMSAAAMAAPVATLNDVTGTVLVDQGRGFALVSDHADLVTGSRVMLSRTGAATLVYPGVDGCRLTLSRNTITTVGSSKDCKPVEQVAGQAPAVVPAVAAPTTITPLAIGLGLGAAALGGLAIATVVAEQEQDQPAASN